MKILFIGPYRQDDGWGHASRSFLKSLTMTSHDVSSAPVYLNRQKEYRKFTDSFILDSENNRLQDYDVVIQNCLPHMFRKYGGVKNIGLSFFESTINNTPWPSSIELMDRMWVSSKFEKRILNQAGIVDKTDVIPIPSDIDLPDHKYEKIVEKADGDFIFYFIGENTTRKNLKALIEAFHLEFKPYEQVKLFLKVNNVGRSQDETFNEVRDMINNVKSRLGLFRDTSMYKSEFLVTRFLSEENLRGIHKDCDCLVMPSSGEGFCIPAFNALLNDSYIIANKNCSISDYVREGANGHLVESTLTPAVAADRPLSFLYNGRDYWYEINVNSLRQNMRDVYSFLTNPLHIEKKTFDVIKKYNKEQVLPNYSFEKVSKDMEAALGQL